MFAITCNRSTKALIYLSVLCLLFMLLRIMLKEQYAFMLLIWNLFLAWIPLWLATIAEQVEHKWAKFSVLTLVLLFFPNSPYIITDLIHLSYYRRDILWFDSLLFFMFAFTGLCIGLVTLKKAHEILKFYLNPFSTWMLISITSLLSGFGIYLGRYCRLNSWDLFYKPLWLAQKILEQFENPLAYKVTLTFALFLFGLYAIFYDCTTSAAQKND